ncbi:alpha-2-macroglobulin-like protein 1 isoform X2 [Pleurodeles waltl]|uniref:alpha-2-macroglobulin-like protein 1 isoform X2 n=1 Tax=Pleurodeles waltl TaxID=8319 RepID=UPI003709AF05
MWGVVPLGSLPLLMLTSVLTHPQPGDPKYLLLVPAALNYPSSQAVCLQVRDVHWPIKLSVQLNTRRGKYRLLSTEVKPGKQLGCTRFTVPEPLGAEEVATVLVQGDQGIQPFEESKTVLIQRRQKGTFLQTDKPVYKAGQSVNFRVVTLNDDFIPQNDKYPLIVVQDPIGNRIVQWLNVTPQKGITDLSFPLSSEPALGTYTIVVGPGAISSTFSVEEYVLPKFEATFVGPSVVSAMDTSVSLRVCGRYTYGKPVHGNVNGTLCRKSYYYWWFFDPNLSSENNCLTFEGQTKRDGCFSTTVNIPITNNGYWGYSPPLEGKATLTEDGTGIMAEAVQTFPISYLAASAIFQEVKSYYIPGVPFTGQIKVMDSSGAAMRGQGVTLQGNGVSQHHTTDNEGMISFSLDTSGWGSEVYLQGTIDQASPSYSWVYNPLYYGHAYHYILPLYSTVRSWMKIHTSVGTLPCSQTQDIRVNYKLDPQDLRPDIKSMEFYYYIIGRKGIIYNGFTSLSINKKDCKGNNELQGSFTIAVSFSHLYAPLARLLVFALFPNGGITADTVPLEISMCFKNKVELAFSAPEDLPGSNVTVQLKASPNSICALRAVDQSVLLMRPERELSRQMVYDLFLGMDRYGYPYQVAEFDTQSCPYYGYVLPSVDVRSLFEEAGLKVFTNSNIKKPIMCEHQYQYYRLEEYTAEPPMENSQVMELPGGHQKPEMAESVNTVEPPSPPSIQDKVRQYFPETWIWDLYIVGPSGHQNFSFTLPDTITEWKAMGFCTSKYSFGLSHTVSIAAFKPFFIELTLPYSVVRGERFGLKATVFNYLEGCISINALLAPPQDHFEILFCFDCQYTACLCSQDSVTFFWNVRPSSLGEVNFTVNVEAVGLCGPQLITLPERGRKDTLIKSVLVRAEGIAQEKSRNLMLCPKGSSVSQEISLVLPNIVSGSQKATIHVFGDIMGSALQNLNNLIQMPYGCGEQNMLTFAPLIYVLQYLKRTGQLTDDIRTRAYTYLQTGYQQELNYKHDDGSYSAFGNSDGSGSTWLTAFVAKCFGQAEEFIFVDNEVTTMAVTWLRQRQSQDGCFENVGMLYHTTMKGGVDDDVSLSAYITSALLELGWPLQDPMMVNGLQCLRNRYQGEPGITSIYTLALLFYTFTLAGEGSTREQLAGELEAQAIHSDGQTHWTYTPRSESNYFWSQPESADVETTAYVLLGYLSVEDRSQIDINNAVAIVSWLSRQQNAYGGYSSTQDTVVALQALAKYAALMYSDKPLATVQVIGPDSFLRRFTVEEENRLLFQRGTLPVVPGNYTVSAEGSGCVFVQVTLSYNTLTHDVRPAFHIIVNAFLTDNLIFTIYLSYNGSRHETNMVLIEIQMPSGFSPPGMVKDQLMGNGFVKRVETSINSVTIYLLKMDSSTQTYSFTANQVEVVDDRQPALVKVYDYYEPGEYAEVMYIPVIQTPSNTTPSMPLDEETNTSSVPSDEATRIMPSDEISTDIAG